MRQLVSALMRKSLADVMRRKGRTLLIVLAILIGVAGLTAINVVVETVGRAIAYTQDESTQPDVSFSVQSVDPALAATLARMPNVQTVQFETSYNTHWHTGPAGQVALTIIGYQDPRHVALAGFQLTSGHYPAAGEIVLETGDGALQSFALGDQVTVDTPQGPMLLRVVGTSRTIGLANPASTGAAIGYMSAGVLDHLIGAANANDIEIKVRNTAQVNQTLDTLEGVLKAQHVKVLAGIPHNNSSSPNASSSGVIKVLRVLVGIAMLLSSMVIITTVTTLIAEQIRTIGTMKALGGTRMRILRSYLLTISLYGVLGTLLGLFLGILCGYELASQALNRLNSDMGPFTVSPAVLTMGGAVGLSVPLLAAFLPVWTGTRITVREAMSAYGISHGSSGSRLHRLLGRRLTWVPQTLWLGLRGLFGRRGRAVLTLVMLIIAGVTFLSVATTNYAIDTKIASFFANYDHDLVLTVQSDPLPWSALHTQVLVVPNVQRVERLGDDTITTTWGGMRLTGVDGDTQLYHRRVVAGRWFAPNERNVVLLSDDAASATGLRVGSILTFSRLGRTITWAVIGIVRDSRADVGAIGVALTTSENFNLVSGNPVDSASMLMIQAHDRSPAAIGQLQARLQTTLKQAGLHITVDSAQQKMQEEIQVTQQQFLPLYVMLYAVAVIVALVGILGLSNTLITSVLERRREIGIWRSMGASGWRVARIFWVEALALAGIAWVGSLLVGVPAAMGFLQLVDHWTQFNVPFAFDSIALGIMLMVLLVVATLASFGPAGSAARLRIADILRYE